VAHCISARNYVAEEEPLSPKGNAYHLKRTIMNIRLPGILLFALSALLLFSGCESESDPVTPE